MDNVQPSKLVIQFVAYSLIHLLIAAEIVFGYFGIDLYFELVFKIFVVLGPPAFLIETYLLIKRNPRNPQ